MSAINDSGAVASVRIVAIVSLAAVLIALIGFGGCHLTNRKAIESGLCQDGIKGSTRVIWVPCAKAEAK